MGGSEFQRVRSVTWVRVPNSGIVPIDSNRLPGGLIEWNANVQCHKGAVAQVRLFNEYELQVRLIFPAPSPHTGAAVWSGVIDTELV